ncbi:hypothetical protein ACFL2A_06740 [Thermodesulfobacteriota bacterium]
MNRLSTIIIIIMFLTVSLFSCAKEEKEPEKKERIKNVVTDHIDTGLGTRKAAQDHIDKSNERVEDMEKMEKELFE